MCVSFRFKVKTQIYRDYWKKQQLFGGRFGLYVAIVSNFDSNSSRSVLLLPHLNGKYVCPFVGTNGSV